MRPGPKRAALSPQAPAKTWRSHDSCPPGRHIRAASREVRDHQQAVLPQDCDRKRAVERREPRRLVLSCGALEAAKPLLAGSAFEKPCSGAASPLAFALSFDDPWAARLDRWQDRGAGSAGDTGDRPQAAVFSNARMPRPKTVGLSRLSPCTIRNWAMESRAYTTVARTSPLLEPACASSQHASISSAHKSRP